MHLDITTRDHKTLKYLLNAYLPGTTVWAFGSRVKFTSKPESDLDLVIFTPEKFLLAELKDAFAESDLPFKVDILDWDIIPDNFKQNIEKDYVVLQDASEEKAQIPQNWKTYKLGNLIQVNKKSINKDFPFDTINYIDTSSVTQNRFKKTPELELFSAPSRARRIVQENDVIYSTVRPVQRHYGFIQGFKPNTIVSTGFAVLTPKKIDPKFLYYYLTKDEIVNYLNGVAESNTTTFPAFNASLFETIDITIPRSSKEQESISSILSSLEDKIELNQQMNQTLEIMAQAIFKEWFVDFNFPGFDGELKDGLPKGWRIGVISDIYKTTSGGTPSRANYEFYTNGNIKWVKSKELDGGFILDTEEKITENAVKNSSAKKFPRHSLLIAMYGATVGQYAIVSSEATCNQAVCAIIPNDVYPYSYILEYVKMNKDNIIDQASGSAQQNISQALIQRQEILIPPPAIVKGFHEIASNLLSKMENNLFENQALTQIRDNLLPRLMSGKIEVKT
ncbi:MAG TPA: restriction endonuclease subunit S [Mucilaginibacter sp.]|jgi:type I restriction enzyme S subunit|nr:restriction endonuclease subunit S [Mucilaginibacter sp.]